MFRPQNPDQLGANIPENRQPGTTRREITSLLAGLLAIGTSTKISHILRSDENTIENQKRREDQRLKEEAEIEMDETAEIEITPEEADFSGLRSAKLIRSFEIILGALNNQALVAIDQNGDIIDEAIDLENTELIADIPVFNRDGKLSQEWLNLKRLLLSLKYPTLFYKKGQYPEIEGRRSALEAESTETTYLDLVWKNCQEKIPEYSKTRLEISEEIFAKSTLPEGLQRLIVSGICSIESMFKDEAKSPAGANGAWQFMSKAGQENGLTIGVIEKIKGYQWKEVPVAVPETPKGKGKRKKKKEAAKPKTKRVQVPIYEKIAVDERVDFVKSTEAASRFFTKIYETLKTYEPLQQIVRKYNLKEESLLFPCVISAFHTGTSRVQKMLNWFNNQYPPADLEAKLGKSLDHDGGDIYVLMSKLFMDSKTDKDYGKYSNNYYVQVQAITNLMEKRKTSPQYHPDLQVKSPYTAPDSVETSSACIDLKVPEPKEQIQPSPSTPDETQKVFFRKFQSLLLGAATGIALGTGGEMVFERTINRRSFLINLAGTWAGGYVGVSLADSERLKDKPAVAPAVIPKFSEKDQLNFGAIQFDPQLGHTLKALPSFIKNPQANEAFTLPKAVHKSQILPWLTKKNPLRFMDRKSVRKAAKRRKLIALQEYNSTTHRCRGIGQQGRDFADARRNDPELLYVYPHLPILIKDITEKLNKELHSLGMADKYIVRPIITSAVRPDDYSVTGQSDTSSHKYAVALDFSRFRFDVIDTNTNTFYSFPDSPKKINAESPFGVDQKLQISTHCFSALSRVLKKMHDEGQIIANDEPAAEHVHIVDLNYDR